MRVSNSFSGDAALDTSPEMRTLSRMVVQYDCIRCHGGYSSYIETQDWIDAGLITPGAGEDSSLIRHLRGTDSIMPPTGSPVDDGTIDSLVEWIDGL